MTSFLPKSGRETLRDLVLLTVLIGALFGIMLGNRPLSVPDEGRYVEIPREMVTTGDYLTPRLNGVKYFEKPVLFYWLEAFSIRLFGLDEFGLRLWPALFALFGCLAVYAAGKRLYGRGTGLFAALVLATSILYYALSRVIILDMPVTVLLTVALLAFLTGIHEPAGMKRRLLLWCFYVCSALAVLTKGLIGMVIPAIVIGSWIALLGEWNLLRSIYLPSGLALFLLIGAPWHILVDRANPEFFNFYFIHEHLQRYLTKVHNRYEPFWFFAPVLLLGMFPWTAFLVQAVTYSAPASWRDRHEHRDALFLMLWAGLVFLFFSASDSKLIPYILPVFPPLAILIGRYLEQAWKNRNLPGIKAGLIAQAVFAAVMLIALFIAHRYRPEINDQALHPYLYAAAFLLVCGTVVTGVLWRRKGFPWALSSIIAVAAAFLILLNAMGPWLDARSVKKLALELKPQLKPEDEVASFFTYYQDLPVYLERRITAVDWVGELEFGAALEDTSSWMIGNETFWKRWKGRGRIYLFMNREVYEALIAAGYRNMHVIADNPETVLVVNKEKK